MDYTSVKVPKVLAEKIMNNPIVISWGYRSVSEFMIESVRLKLMKRPIPKVTESERK